MNALALLVSLALGATPSSRLGPVALGPATDGPRDAVLAVCPRVALVELSLDTGELIRSYKIVHCSNTTLVVRAPLAAGVRYTVEQNASADADAAATAVLQALQIAGIVGTQVDWVSGPGPENLPAWTDSNAGAWLATFWSRFADDLSSAGFSPLVGAIDAGDPPLAGELGAGSENGFAQAAAAMKRKPYPWAWSYRAFAPALDASPDPRLNPALRYRAIRDECGLGDAHLVIEQAGFRTAAGKGWRAAAVSGTDYLAWLHWLDMQARRDSEVVGVAAFQFGDSSRWADDSLDELADGFRALLDDDSEPDGGTAGDDAGRPVGSVGDPIDGPGTPVPPLKNTCGCGASGAAGPALGFAGLLALAVRGARANRPRRR